MPAYPVLSTARAVPITEDMKGEHSRLNANLLKIRLAGHGAKITGEPRGIRGTVPHSGAKDVKRPCGAFGTFLPSIPPDQATGHLPTLSNFLSQH